MDMSPINPLFAQVDSNLALIQSFIDWNMVTLEVTSERKLKQTLGVDSCYKNLKNEDCSKFKWSKCVNKEIWGVQMLCNMFMPIISSWAYLPAFWSWLYTTVTNFQTTLPFSIYEWESRFASENEKIWRVILENLPRRLALKAWWRVNFSIDTIWNLYVQVVDSSNNQNIIASRIENALKIEDELKMKQWVINLGHKIEWVQKSISWSSLLVAKYK
jgi:molecular chaperone DnaK (HSP70)